jgi:poly(3-hydroxybutyrate) depolymerase
VTGAVRLRSGRTYTVGVDQTAHPDAPTVVVLHGLYGTVENVRMQTGFDAVGRAERWNVVYGQGLDSSWNAGGCCGRAAKRRTDDVGYLRDVAAHLRSRGHRGPVYLAGFSNGGMLALRAACEHPETFARVASVGGPLVAPCPRPIVARHLHGRSDTVVPYRGGWSEFCQVTFPDTTTEGRRVGRGSDYALVSYDGGHGLPKKAIAYVREFFATGSSDVAV